MKKGFTLIELLIVVIVVAILATFAVPQYLKVVEKTKGAKATHNGTLITNAEKMHRAELDLYLDVANDVFAASVLNDFVEMVEIDADTDWTYDVTLSDASTFLLTMVRVDGPNATETITVDQDGVVGGTFAP